MHAQIALISFFRHLFMVMLHQSNGFFQLIYIEKGYIHVHQRYTLTHAQSESLFPLIYDEAHQRALVDDTALLIHL